METLYERWGFVRFGLEMLAGQNGCNELLASFALAQAVSSP